jgi:acetolactate synthase-1/2/3 large subunit
MTGSAVIGTETMPAATGAQRLAGLLKAAGVRTIFGQSIPATLLHETAAAGIRQVAYRTENAGGAMADGYARCSNELGVVAAQNGPAAALLVAPLAEALKASVPLLAIVQDVPRPNRERHAFQEFDHASLLRGCTKGVLQVDSRSNLEQMASMAIRQAVSNRPGPVALVVPADVLEGCGRGRSAAPAHAHFPAVRYTSTGTDLERAARALRAASRPLAIAGGGVHLSDATGALRRLQKELGLPVMTTNMGKGAVDETHDLSLGVIGNCMGEGSPANGIREHVRSADVILLVGTRTNQNGTDSWRAFGTGTRFIQIDVDAGEFGRNFDALPLPGDAREVLGDLHARLSDGPLRPQDGLIDASRRSKEQVRAFLDALEASSGCGPLQPHLVLDRLSRALPDDAVVVADASYATNWVATYCKARARQRYLMPRGLAGLGWGVPMAIGAKASAPHAAVIAVVGDGAFGHCWSELSAALREQLPIVVVVLNNGVLGYQKHAEEQRWGSSTHACDLAPVDHAAVARAQGCLGIRVSTLPEFEAALLACLDSHSPAVIDVLVDPRARPPLSLFERPNRKEQ